MRRPPFRRFRESSSGAAILEFALVAPVLIVLLFGVICYGGYFWLAHDVQQAANDAARSALAGLDAPERATIARRSVQTHLASNGSLDTARTAIAVAERNGEITVTVSYDASQSPFWRVADLFPMPSQVIDRSATATLGGF